ncbi:hypothetical protein JNB11_00395 [Kocuria palustris]|nr:hypothetical protein [Kocuria palustris]
MQQPTFGTTPFNDGQGIFDITLSQLVSALVQGAQKALDESGLSISDLLLKAAAAVTQLAAQYQPLVEEYFKEHPLNITAGILPAIPVGGPVSVAGGQPAAAPSASA